MIVLGILAIIWLFFLEWKIKGREVEPPTRHCSEKVDYFNYVVTKQKNTEDALRQLQESE